MNPTLAHHVVTAPGASPSRTAFVLHGILGNGRNWLSVARRLAKAAPSWRFILVDLRCHGDSLGFLPPHTVAACACDLAELAAHLEEEPQVILAHSFGGKVALLYARDYAASLERVWLLDAPAGPSTGGVGEVERVIAALGQIPQPVPSRQAVQEAVQSVGLSLSLAKWMTTNLRKTEGGFVWAFDLPAVRDLLADYRELDLWSVLEHPPGVAIDVVKGAKSDRFDGLDSDRIRASAATLHILEDAGHWLHADNPSGLHALLLPSFTTS